MWEKADQRGAGIGRLLTVEAAMLPTDSFLPYTMPCAVMTYRVEAPQNVAPVIVEVLLFRALLYSCEAV